MILALAATQIEMQPFLQQWPGEVPPCLTLETGVGPTETAVRLTRFLSITQKKVHAVVHFGVGGAYLQASTEGQPQLLDICLAEQEVFGDLGICLRDGVDYLPAALTGVVAFQLDTALHRQGRQILESLGISTFSGTFITVNSITATRQRGAMLQQRWQGLCENMEGAAVARVCREFSIPCLELRAVSNFVEDRNPEKWRLREACLRAAEGAALLIKGMSV
ncbi:MAG: futalosine hydrolase [Desulforhopalus sp.]|nr:futalosine hydrolase [Desulforhopalus sp.]